MKRLHEQFAKLELPAYRRPKDHQRGLVHSSCCWPEQPRTVTLLVGAVTRTLDSWTQPSLLQKWAKKVNFQLILVLNSWPGCTCLWTESLRWLGGELVGPLETAIGT